jgi:hypothetical protein
MTLNSATKSAIIHFCPGTGDIDVDSLIALGVEHGCEFSAEDLAADAELSDEQLEAVAGGVSRFRFERPENWWREGRV